MTIVGQVFYRMGLAGIFALPLSTLMLLLDLFMKPSKFQSAEAPYLVFRDVHIITAILGEAMAIGAFTISMMYLWQHQNLKNKILDQITNKVPALDKLDKLLNLTLWLGMLFLTTALISGAYYTTRSAAQDGITLKVIWALSVWIWYMAILVLKNVLKKSTSYVAKLSLVGFFFLAISLFGVIF